MTISSTTTRQDYTGDGVTVAFAFGFKTYASTHVQVLLDGVVQAAGFTTLLNANQDLAAGGTVTFLAAPEVDVVVRLQRVVPLTQETNLGAHSAFPSEAVERTIDRAIMAAQQVKRDLDDFRSVDPTAQAMNSAAAALLSEQTASTSASAASGSAAAALGSNNAAAAAQVAAEAAQAAAEAAVLGAALSSEAPATAGLVVVDSTKQARNVLLTQDVAVCVPDAPGAAEILLQFTQDATGSRKVFWPNTIIWAGGTVPTMTVTPGKSDVYRLTTLSGTIWYGSVVTQALDPVAKPRISGTLAQDFTVAGAHTLSPGASATGAFAAFNAGAGAWETGWTEALGSGQFAGVVADGAFDLSAGDRVGIEIGFPGGGAYRCNVDVRFSCDVNVADYLNYARKQDMFQQLTLKADRLVLTTTKASCTVTGVMDWAAVKHIEVRVKRSLANVQGAVTMRVFGAWANAATRPQIMLTFDDGWDSVYDDILPRLTAAGMRATAYLVTSYLTNPSYITAAQALELKAKGWDLGDHSFGHTAFAKRISSYSRVGTTATMTFNEPHGYSVGNTLEIQGCDEPEFNGVKTVVTTPNNTTITFDTAGTSAETTVAGRYYIVGGVSTPAMQSQIDQSATVFAANGFGPVEHFAYPYGNFSPEAVAFMGTTGIKTSRSTAGGYGDLGYYRTLNGLRAPHRLPSISIDNRTAAQLLSWVDSAITEQASLIFIGHRIAPVGDATAMAIAEFETFIAGLATRRAAGQIDVVTVSEWFDRL